MRALALICGLLAACTSASTSDTSAEAAAAHKRDAADAADGAAPADDGLPVLLVASDLDNRPFAWVDESGAAQGRDVEMMTALAHLLHRRLQWQRMPFDELLAAVEAGQVDVVCATLGVTPEREERVDFTRPYFETQIAVVVRVGEGEPDALAALRGVRISAGAGTTSERAVLQRLPSAIGVFENKAGLPTAQRLLSHEVDAAVMDGPAADALVSASAGQLRRLPESLGAEHYALALPKAQRPLRDQLDHALDTFQRAGSLARWNEKYGLALPAARK